jgi:hypothetical protein
MWNPMPKIFMFFIFTCWFCWPTCFHSCAVNSSDCKNDLVGCQIHSSFVSWHYLQNSQLHHRKEHYIAWRVLFHSLYHLWGKGWKFEKQAKKKTTHSDTE